METDAQKAETERLYAQGMSLRAAAIETGASCEAAKKWCREGNWTEKRKSAVDAGTKRQRKTNRLLEASQDLEEALQLAAAGLKKKMAEDADGAGIADGPFRAWNLTNLSSAISQQAETHALLNKRQEEKKETGGVMIELDKESEALAE